MIFWLAYLDQFFVFVLVLTRFSTLLMTMPAVGSRDLPLQIRALLAVGLALLVTPVFWGSLLDRPATLLELLVMLGREALLGLSLGLALQLVLAGLQLAGQIIGQMSGMALADVFDPTFETNVPIFSQLVDLVAVALFFGIGGHRYVMAALLDSFAQLPPGSGGLPPGLVDALLTIAGQSFATALQAAGPVVVALLMSILVLGLVSRTLPQLNVLAVGFSFNSLVVLAMLAMSVGAAALVFQEHVELAIRQMYAALAGAAST